MSGGRFGNALKQPLGKFLFWLTFGLILFTLLTAGVASYAKYVSSQESNNVAGVADMGIEIFELKEHGVTFDNVDLTKVVPGVDIPGPHIKLKMYSEVSWAVYVKVTERGFPVADELDYRPGNKITGRGNDGRLHNVVIYDVSADWELVDVEKSKDPDGTMHYVKTYRYNEVFQPATSYDLTDSTTAIQFLAGEYIFISEHYGNYDYENGGNKPGPQFGLTFEAYIRQVQ